MFSAFKSTALWLGLSITTLLLCPASEAAVIGSAAPARIDIVEEHSEALCLWFKAGKRNLTAINVDAHSDFFSTGGRFEHDIPRIKQALTERECSELLPLVDSYINPGDLYGIGDFLQVAYKLGIIKELWWVIPAQETLPPAEFGKFKQWLEYYWRFPQPFLDSLRYDGKVVRGDFNGLPVNMVTLADLPTLDEEVLLTIDVDYFYELNKRTTEKSMLALLDWFFATLKEKALNSSMVEIATSVPNFYTPLRYKYTAGRVADWLRNPAPPPSAVRELQLWQAAFERALAAGDYPAAELQTARLVAREPDSPVAHYNFALLQLEKGDYAAALRALEVAIEKDASYQYGYLSLSRTLHERELSQAAFAVAVKGHEKHPQNIPLAELLGNYHLLRKDYAAATAVYRELLKKAPTYLSAEFGLAEALFRQGQVKAAQQHFDRYLKNLQPGSLRDRSLQQWQAISTGR